MTKADTMPSKTIAKRKLITKPGVYDLSEAAYHADPCEVPSLSSGVAWTMISRSARHGWKAHPRLNPKWQPSASTTFDLGKAAHHMVLGDPGRYVIVHARDFRTNTAKRQRDGARKNGKIPLLKHQYERVEELADACHRQLAAHQEASDAFTNGAPEKTIVWEENGVVCRARLDWMPNDGNVFYNLKTTGGAAETESWIRNYLYPLGYDTRAAFYCRGIRAVFGIPDPIYRFVVIETDDPYGLNVIQLQPGAMAIAHRKALAAIDLWRTCMERGQWPGYPALVSHVEAPPWTEQRWLEREDREQALKAEGRSYFDLMLEWQSPIEPKAAAE